MGFGIFHPTIATLESYIGLYNRHYSIDAYSDFRYYFNYIELYSRTVFPDVVIPTHPLCIQFKLLSAEFDIFALLVIRAAQLHGSIGRAAKTACSISC